MTVTQLCQRCTRCSSSYAGQLYEQTWQAMSEQPPSFAPALQQMVCQASFVNRHPLGTSRQSRRVDEIGPLCQLTRKCGSAAEHTSLTTATLLSVAWLHYQALSLYKCMRWLWTACGSLSAAWLMHRCLGLKQLVQRHCTPQRSSAPAPASSRADADAGLLPLTECMTCARSGKQQKALPIWHA